MPTNAAHSAARRAAQRREDRIKRAVEAINEGCSYRQAVSTFKVPLATLQRHATCVVQKRGRKRALSDAEEQLIVNVMKSYAHNVVPATERHLKEAFAIVLSSMASSRRLMIGISKDSPSPKFLRNFRRRHSAQLRFGRPLRQQSARLNSINGEAMSNHYATLQLLMEQNNVDAERIFNLDEVGVSPDLDFAKGSRTRRLIPRTLRYMSPDMWMAAWTYHHRVTMMPVVSAAGDMGPTILMFKGDKLPYRTVLRNGSAVVEIPACNLPRRSVVATRTEMGGVDSNNFLSWAWEFIAYVRDLTDGDRKVLLIYDGYRAHISLSVLKLFRDNGIIVYALPSHSSGKTEPLDVVVFSAFKAAFKNAVNECVLLQDNRPLDIFDFCSLLKVADDTAFSSRNITSGFRRSGIFPLNAQRLLGVPRPACDADNVKLMSVEQLSEKLHNRRQELRQSILGSDAKMLTCGYVDTSQGCVMTSPRVLDISKQKADSDARKRFAEQGKRDAAEMRAAKEDALRRESARSYREERLRARARLAGETVDVFAKHVRSFAERRAAEKYIVR